MKRSLSLALLLLTLFALVVSSAAGPAFAQPPAQGGTPTPEPEIGPANPTPSPTRPVTRQTPPPGGGTINGTPVAPPRVQLPPTFEELLRRFPDLQPYLEKAKDLDIASPEQLAELYVRIVQIYTATGAGGVATFLKDSGILDRLNIPLSYLDLLLAYEQGGPEAVRDMARQRRIINQADEIVGYLAIDAESNYAALREALERLGVTVYDYIPDTEEVEIGIPLDLLGTYQTPGSLLGYFALIANSPHVVGFRVPVPTVTSERQTNGVRTTLAAQNNGSVLDLIGAAAWHDANIKGAGVKIGILSYGWEGISDALGSDLPEEVAANAEIDELNEDQGILGLITAALVHRAAPEAELVIASYDPSNFKSKMAALDYLAEEEIKILISPTTVLIGPRDGTSPDTQVVEQFVRDHGVLWVNPAGNEATGHTAFEFNPGENNVHFFNEEANLMPFQALGSFAVVAMNWNGNWAGGERNEYIFKVFDKDQKEVVTAAEPRRGKKNQFPYQIAAFETEPGEIYYLLVARTRGDETNTIDVVVTNSQLPDWALVTANTVLIPGDAESVLTVGATNLEDKVFTFSGQGPTADDRLKPDLVIPTGDPILSFEDGFFSTVSSAATLAGAAALVAQAYPDLSGPELKGFLTQNVEDLGDEGPDPAFGAGRLALPEPENVDPDNPNKGQKEPQPNDEPSATVTDVTAKFNVKVKGKRGVAISVSFEVDNYNGKTLGVLLVVFDENGDPIEPQDEKYAVKVSKNESTVGTAAVFRVKADQTVFEDVPLWIPNSAFGSLKSGTDLIMRVLVLDVTDQENITRLALSDPIEVRVK